MMLDRILTAYANVIALLAIVLLTIITFPWGIVGYLLLTRTAR